MTRSRFVCVCVCALAVAFVGGLAPASAQITLEFLGRHSTGIFGESATEIAAHDPETQRLFVTNAAEHRVTVVDISDPSDPAAVFTIDISDFGDNPTSVSVSAGVLAVAVTADPETDNGSVVFFTTAGEWLATVEVGAFPDMLTFTPDGQKVLVANEGQPSDDYMIDPEGSVSIIDLSGGIDHIELATADFSAFNSQADSLRARGVRIFGPGATAAQDFEPEYIAVSADSSTAWVALQENNAFAVVDIDDAEVTRILPLGYKPHWIPGNGFDGSDRDDAINIGTWPVLGMYQPDGLATMRWGGMTFVLSANEGDARDYDEFSEEFRLEDLTLSPSLLRRFPTIQERSELGRLRVTSEPPRGKRVDANGDATYSRIYSYGARSFSIWTSSGQLVYDSGDDFEQITAARLPDDFNSNNDENDTFDARSDDKGPEPETVVTGEIDGRTYAFIGMERIGGIMIYDVTVPFLASFVDYINTRDFSILFDPDDPDNPEAPAADAGDLAPEGLKFIPSSKSPNGEPLLVVANEVSGTTTIYRIVGRP